MKMFRKTRISHTDFIFTMIGLSIAWSFLQYYILSERFAATEPTSDMKDIKIYGAVALQIALSIYTIFLLSQRLRDANKPLWIVLIILLAIGFAGYIHIIFMMISFLMLIIIALLPGTIGPNKYGPDPRGWESKEHYDAQEKRLADEQKNIDT